MKGKTQIFAVITFLFLLFLSPGISSADTQTTSNSTSSLIYENVDICGTGWIFVFDGGKLIDTYPE